MPPPTRRSACSIIAIALASGVLTNIAAPAQAALPRKDTTFRGPLELEGDDGWTRAGTVIIKVADNRRRLKSFRVKIDMWCVGPFDNTYRGIPVKADGSFSQTSGPVEFAGEFTTKRKATGTFKENSCAPVDFRWRVRARD